MSGMSIWHIGGKMSQKPEIDRWTWKLIKEQHLAEWMAGFFDGEGTVRIKIIKRKRQRTGYEMTVRAEIEQRYVAGIFDAEGIIKTEVAKSEYGDVPYNIGSKASMGLGVFPEGLIETFDEYCNIVDVEPSYYEEQDGDILRFVVSSRDEVYRFLEGIYPYTIIKRPQIKIMLEQVIPMMEQGKHLNKKGFLELMEVVDELNSYKGGARGKYNKQYFEDEWKDDDGNWTVEVGEISNRGRQTNDNDEVSSSLEELIEGDV